MFAVRVYLIQTERKGDARAASHEMFEALSKHRCSIHYGEGAYFRRMRSVFMDAFHDCGSPDPLVAVNRWVSQMLTCTCSREQVIMVLLKAVATHGDTASSHHWLQGVMHTDLSGAMQDADVARLENVLLPLARVYPQLQALRSAMRSLHERTRRASSWVHAARSAAAAAVTCAAAAETAFATEPTESVRLRVERVLIDDCPGLLEEARLDVLNAYRVDVPFSRSAAVARAFGARLARSEAVGCQDSEEGEERGTGIERDASVGALQEPPPPPPRCELSAFGALAPTATAATANAHVVADANDVRLRAAVGQRCPVSDEDVHEAVASLLQHVREQYMELADDAGELAQIYLLSVGGLLREWSPAGPAAAEAVLEAVNLVGHEVKRQRGREGMEALVAAAEQALATFALPDDELALIRKDILSL